MKIGQELASEKCILYLGELFCIFWNCLLATSLSNDKNITGQHVDITYKTQYFYIRESRATLEFSSTPKDGSDIHRFPIVHMVETNFLLENL